MRDGVLKDVLKATVLREGAVRRIIFGPLRGYRFQINAVTGLSPWYSGVERPQQHVIERYVSNGDTVIDIGANWGVHTLLMARLVGRSGRVVACEPSPATLETLRWHVTANDCPQVAVCPVALSNTNGVSAFDASGHACENHLSAPGTNTIDVAVRRLDDLWDEMRYGPVRFIKVDVEGAEFGVIDGATALLKRDHPVLMIALDGPLETAQRVCERLKGLGYSFSRVEDGRPITQLDAAWPHPNGPWGTLLAVASS